MDGILNIYKEKGYTSHDVVAKLRGILKQKKIGHTGTLDPDAVGVLPVCLGKATKLCDMLTDTTKEYRAVLLLGVETDTQDLGGTILSEHPVTASVEEVEQAILSFVGPYEQVPPMYSALKVGGQKLCDLARQGKTVERKARRVEIFSISIHRMELPHIEMTVSCSKGTYIRTLCHDIGQALGCGGAMEELTRTRSGRFLLEEGMTLKQVEQFRDEGLLKERILPVEAMFEHLPQYRCPEEFGNALKNGNPLKVSGNSLTPGDYRVIGPEGDFVGIYHWEQGQKLLKPKKLFFL
ncbi:tRNA pseudouridine(55) synthase TruB [Hominifimenecus sp. rT4P-3]|uniref:tRNA pseudouridine(55) synthase TruB n=1 Tax=Hominifimenecus sp. rT4P-3 TaxID=3242979 RepID=UPI003DA592EF